MMIVVTAVTFRPDSGYDHTGTGPETVGAADVLGTATAEGEVETVIAAVVLETAKGDAETACAADVMLWYTSETPTQGKIFREPPQIRMRKADRPRRGESVTPDYGSARLLKTGALASRTQSYLEAMRNNLHQLSKQ